jgi:nitrous oxidase accessory protein
MIRYWLVIGLCMGELLWISTSLAAVIPVMPGDSTLQSAIDNSTAGDTLELHAGIYGGPVIISHSLSIIGSPDSVIDGKGTGDVVHIDAPEVVIRGVKIRNSGNSLEHEDSGVFVTDRGDRALIEGCFFEGNLIGIYLKGPEDAVVRSNVIVGSQYFRMNDRGNGVYLWNTPGSRVENNDIRFGRDGIFVTTSHHNAFINNNFSDLRFAIHYMYTHDSDIIGNHSSGNHSAFALMFSDRLTVIGNESSDDRDRGLFLNFVNKSTMENNRVSGGVEKCVFIYNANMNSFSGNRFQGCDIGIHFTAGSEKNEIFNNSFVANKTQVKYVGTRSIEWSHQGRGNYWSDNTAFDLDGDGIADRVYKPNSLVDQLVWKYPLAKLLLGSPVMQMLHWVQSEFPTLHPGGVSDSAPLMQPPTGV